MPEYRNFICRHLDDQHVVCEDVHFPSGAICTIYFSPSGVYALSSGTSSPKQRYHEVYGSLGAARFRFYSLGHGDGSVGRYDPMSDILGPSLDEDELSAEIGHWLHSGRKIYDAAAIDRMIAQLKSIDIRARGYAVMEDGELFLYRRGRLFKASSHNSDSIYYLTLFGGVLGLHRLALGKLVSGACYLFTGGLFLVGWILDLMQLFFGVLKDRKKRYLFPLSNRRSKSFILPFGLLLGFLLFLGYLFIVERFGLALQISTNAKLQADPQVLPALMDVFIKLFSR